MVELLNRQPRLTVDKSIYTLRSCLLLDDPSLPTVPFQNCLLHACCGPKWTRSLSTLLSNRGSRLPDNQTLPRPTLGCRPRPALQLWPSARDPWPGLSGGCGRRLGLAPGPENVPAKSTHDKLKSPALSSVQCTAKLPV